MRVCKTLTIGRETKDDSKGILMESRSSDDEMEHMHSPKSADFGEGKGE